MDTQITRLIAGSLLVVIREAGVTRALVRLLYCGLAVKADSEGFRSCLTKRCCEVNCGDSNYGHPQTGRSFRLDRP